MNKPTIKLTDVDGNAFVIMSVVRLALREYGQKELIEQFTKEATSGDYDNLLQTVFKYCDVE